MPNLGWEEAMSCHGALCDHPYSALLLCFYKSTVEGKEGLHVGGGGFPLSYRAWPLLTSHSEKSAGASVPLATLPPFWRTEGHLPKILWAISGSHHWEASCIHCAFSFLHLTSHLANVGSEDRNPVPETEPFRYFCGTWEWFQYSTINIF